MLHIGNELELVPDLWLTTGLAAIYARRETQVTYPQGQAPLSQHDWDYAPRIGLRYDVNPQLQVYGNVSRSVEPPHAWSMIWGSNKYFAGGAATGLAREGVQFEKPDRHHPGNRRARRGMAGQWDLALYPLRSTSRTAQRGNPAPDPNQQCNHRRIQRQPHRAPGR